MTCKVWKKNSNLCSIDIKVENHKIIYMKINRINISEDCTVTILAFGKEWNVLQEYKGAVPADKKHWYSIKDAFYQHNSHENPLLMDILLSNGSVVSVYLYGFRIPERPMVICFGSDATRGRAVLCQLVTTKEYIAIHW